MASKPNGNSSAFQRFALVVLAVLYSMLTAYQFLSYAAYKLKHSVRYLREGYSGSCFHSLRVKPGHLVLVFSEHVIRYADVAKFIFWCYEADIKYVTLYEPRGSLKNSFEELLGAIGKLSRNKFKVKIHFISPNGHEERASFNNVQNEIHVHLAAAEDGRGAIVEAAKKLHQVQTEVTMKTVDNMLRVTCDWPEPDLLIRCGGLNTHLGFLPWALRLTEFADLYSHHYLFPSEFLDILTTFAGTDRRCGR